MYVLGIDSELESNVTHAVHMGYLYTVQAVCLPVYSSLYVPSRALLNLQASTWPGTTLLTEYLVTVLRTVIAIIAVQVNVAKQRAHWVQWCVEMEYRELY